MENSSTLAGRGLFPVAEEKIGKIIGRLASWLALAGGIVLAAIALLTVFSIVGRALIVIGLQPIPGDFELVEAGCAIAVFSFLPWCQYKRNHVTVDILSDLFPLPLQGFLRLIGDIALGLIATIVAMQLWRGLAEKFSYGETTFILGMPVWYGYGLSVIGAILFSLTCVYTVWRSYNEMISHRTPTIEQTDH